MTTAPLEHDRMVEVLIAHLKEHGFANITADLPGYSCPQKIIWKETQTGHIPDVRAEQGGREYLFEVEDAKCLELEHTASQFKLFGAYAHQHNAQFVVLVPAGSKSTAERVLANLGASADIWTI